MVHNLLIVYNLQMRKQISRLLLYGIAKLRDSVQVFTSDLKTPLITFPVNVNGFDSSSCVMIFLLVELAISSDSAICWIIGWGAINVKWFVPSPIISLADRLVVHLSTRWTREHLEQTLMEWSISSIDPLHLMQIFDEQHHPLPVLQHWWWWSLVSLHPVDLPHHWCRPESC